MFDIAGSSLFVDDKNDELYILAFLASKVGFHILSAIAPTVNFQIGNIGSLPLVMGQIDKEKIIDLAQENIAIARKSWNAYEEAWDFVKSPLINGETLVENSYLKWEKSVNEWYEVVKKNEEDMNEIFIKLYELENIVSKEVVERDISITKADVKADMVRLISYAVGCMFGRYSLDNDKLVYAGGFWNNSMYEMFIPDKDNCIPITDEEYFEDDIVGLFCEWLKTVYGEKTLEENLTFIAKALGNKGKTSREIIRNYFLNDFIKDHIKIYQKRPIYWMFDSGKQNGFKALCYMHRWNADTIGNVRVEYLHKMQKV